MGYWVNMNDPYTFHILHMNPNIWKVYGGY
jgi:hypothetical protein